ncbi:unnamed protein product [Schistosoma mattheei]|uniref:Uncharacterized protein n=1 Tax=Schistosoma mattheei TaxID=31246 RepID=A0A183NEL0_9TREM|nr:unnamed protein product [Schistosoma mattheei]
MSRITLDGDPNTNVGMDNTECEDIMGRQVPGESYIEDRIMRTFTLKEQHVMQWATCKAGRFGVHGRPSLSTPHIATNAKEDSHCSGPFFRNRPQYLQRRKCDSKVKRNEHLTTHT